MTRAASDLVVRGRSRKTPPPTAWINPTLMNTAVVLHRATTDWIETRFHRGVDSLADRNGCVHGPLVEPRLHFGHGSSFGTAKSRSFCLIGGALIDGRTAHRSREERRSLNEQRELALRELHGCAVFTPDLRERAERQTLLEDAESAAIPEQDLAELPRPVRCFGPDPYRVDDFA
jgi:hypothetical protein